ncbi:hypothetical protein GALL_391050 [mine drainage metagenome]|uniref:Uncharacterized protein n=1 Tax=mine drainage metagenome TaxID=410659 RepID=A0A1J5QGS1_9ZZZZ
MADVAGELDRHGAAGPPQTQIAIGRRTIGQDHRHGRERDQIVDRGRQSEQPLVRGQRRFGAHHAALALQAFQQRGFLAADIGAGTAANFQMKGPAAAEDIRAQIVADDRSVDGFIQYLQRMRIFRTQIDVTLRRPDREAGNGHAFDQHERVAFHDHAVGKGARVAFVGIADDVLLLGAGIEHRLPLDSGGEGRAATSTQPGLGDFLDDGRAIHGQRPFQAAIAIVVEVILQGNRIGDADAGEGQAFLIFQVGNVLRQSEPQPMLAAAQESAVEQAGYVLRVHRAIGNPALGGGDFDQRFQPEQPVRAVAYNFDAGSALRRLGCDGRCHLVGAQ